MLAPVACGAPLNAAHVRDLVLLMSLISYCERVPRNDRLLLALPLAILARVSPILVLSSGCFGYFLT